MRIPSGRQLAATFIPSGIILAIVLAVRVIYHVPILNMTMDVTAIAGIHPLSGFVSNLGIVTWAATAATCAFGAAVLSRTGASAASRFLFWSALVTSYVLVDDLFQIHESLAEQYLGVSDKLPIAFLVIMVVVYFVTFRRDVRQTDFAMLVLALVFFVTSVTIDLFLVERFPTGYGLLFLEDGTKLLGVACWCSYYVRTSYELVLGDFGTESLATRTGQAQATD